MPVFNNPKPMPVVESPPVSSAPKPYRNTVVDSHDTPIESLAVYIGGSNWTVNYYSQIVGQHESLKAFDPAALTAYQSYHRILNLDLKLQGALSHSDEQDTGRHTVSGTAIVTPIPGLIPNEGDAFIADIGEGQSGQFTISAVTKMSYNRGAAYTIDFKLARLADQSLTDLIDSRCIKTSYYRKDLLVLGNSPLIVESDYDALMTFEKAIEDLSQFWINHFYSNTHRTFLVPGQPQPLYDPYVCRAALNLMSGVSNRFFNKAIEYTVDDYRVGETYDLYTAVIKRDAHAFYQIFKTFGVVYSRYLNGSLYQTSIAHSGIALTVIPLNRLMNDRYNEIIERFDEMGGEITLSNGYTVLASHKPAASSCFADPNIPCSVEDILDSFIDDNQNGLDDRAEPFTWDRTLPGRDIPLIGYETYVLSDAFYKNEPQNCTAFERLVLQVLDRSSIDEQAVRPFIKAVYDWPALEQYYLIPLLICIMKATIRGF